MKPLIKHLSSKIIPAIVFVVITGLVVVTTVCLIPHNPTPTVQSAKVLSNSASQTSPANSSNMPATTKAGSFNSKDFQLRPLPVAYASDKFQWTSADAKNTNVIRQLAHNLLEYVRMVAENDRIMRRQLVYHKDTVDAQIQRAMLAGQPIQQLVLPGLDGQEVRFEINSTDLNPSGQQGTFSGKVVGQPDSMVTLAFKGGREAFTILDPSQNLNLVGEPREPGELIVKQIDPQVYIAGANCGNQ